jgi:Asp/Glu/hydantoin racemase
MTILILNPNTTHAMTEGVKDSIKLLGYEVQYAWCRCSGFMTND